LNKYNTTSIGADRHHVFGGLSGGVPNPGIMRVGIADPIYGNGVSLLEFCVDQKIVERFR
jgi:hypothetical protein